MWSFTEAWPWGAAGLIAGGTDGWWGYTKCKQCVGYVSEYCYLYKLYNRVLVLVIKLNHDMTTPELLFSDKFCTEKWRQLTLGLFLFTRHQPVLGATMRAHWWQIDPPAQWRGIVHQFPNATMS